MDLGRVKNESSVIDVLLLVVSIVIDIYIDVDIGK